MSFNFRSLNPSSTYFVKLHLRMRVGVEVTRVVILFIAGPFVREVSHKHQVQCLSQKGMNTHFEKN
jgi:hypothetical protein